MELGGAAPWARARPPQPVPATAERSLGVCSGDTGTRRVPAARRGRAGLGRAARRARVVPAHPRMSCRAVHPGSAGASPELPTPPCVGAQPLPPPSLRLRGRRAEGLDGRGGVLRPDGSPQMPRWALRPAAPECFSRVWPSADSCHTVRGRVSSSLPQKSGCHLPHPHRHLQVRDSFPGLLRTPARCPPCWL